MLHEEESSKCITTSCSNLDEILGGGIHCKEVTEIGQSAIQTSYPLNLHIEYFPPHYSVTIIIVLTLSGGVPGIGKTQLG